MSCRIVSLHTSLRPGQDFHQFSLLLLGTSYDPMVLRSLWTQSDYVGFLMISYRMSTDVDSPHRLLGAIVTLGGVALQSTSRSVEVFVAARIIRRFCPDCNSPLLNYVSVGIGLTFSLTASPLLITEVAYPTLVSLLVSEVTLVAKRHQIASAPPIFIDHASGRLTAHVSSARQDVGCI
jgi:hypothetical protein